MRIAHQRFPRLFKDSDRGFATDGWKLIEKHLERIAFFQVIKEVLDRDPSTGEYRTTTLNVRVDNHGGPVHMRTP